MATKKAASVVVQTPEVPAGYEYILAPLGRNEEQDYIVSVNGVNYAIPQDGEWHLVKSEVAYEYNRSERAKRKFTQRQDLMHANAKII